LSIFSKKQGEHGSGGIAGLVWGVGFGFYNIRVSSKGEYQSCELKIGTRKKKRNRDLKTTTTAKIQNSCGVKTGGGPKKKMEYYRGTVKKEQKQPKRRWGTKVKNKTTKPQQRKKPIRDRGQK